MERNPKMRNTLIIFLTSDCDNSLRGTNAPTALADCSTPCTGNTTETCGAGNRLNLFFNTAAPPTGPITTPSVGNWKSIGCYRCVVSDAIICAVLTISCRSKRFGECSLARRDHGHGGQRQRQNVHYSLL